nr:38.7 kDa protein [Darna trima granulovirus]
MNYYWNKISEYVWGASKKINQRLYACEIRLDLLTHYVKDLYQLTVNTSLDEKRLLIDDDYENDDKSVGVFLKMRINDETQIQFLTGSARDYQVKKKIYQGWDCVIEEYNVVDPVFWIQEITNSLIECGFDVIKINENSIIIKEVYERVKNELTKKNK